MPAMVACGRHWEFGSDDLFFPSLASIAVRCIWFLGTVGGASYFRHALLCEPMHYLAIFTLTLLVLTLLGILIEAAILVVSARGTIVHVRPRRGVVPLIYVRMALLVMEVALLIIGTVFAFMSQAEVESVGRGAGSDSDSASESKSGSGSGSEGECPDLATATIMMKVVVGMYWFAFVVFVVVVATYMDPCHCYSAKVNYHQVIRRVEEKTVDQDVVEMQWNLVHSQWEKRFKVLCCVAGSDDVHQLAYQEVAEIFAHLFCDTNVVMSDIVAGLVLLQKEHLALEGEERRRRHSWRSGEGGGGGGGERGHLETLPPSPLTSTTQNTASCSKTRSTSSNTPWACTPGQYMST